MIQESRYWKTPLLDAAQFIEAALTGPLPDEDELGHLEYLIMTGFFSIRKLIEAQTKVSDATQHLTLKLTRYEIVKNEDELARRPDLMNRQRIDELYDFTKRSTVTKDISYVSNQFVHSYIFNFEVDQIGRLDAILFASDKDKDKFCNYLSLKQIAEVFTQFGNDYPNSLKMQRDQAGEWKII